MFDHKHGNGADAPLETVVSANTEIRGDILFSGGLRVMGHIQGNVTSSNDTHGALMISNTGLVTGDIQASRVSVDGTINGNLHCAGAVELHPSATIAGDVHYRTLRLDLGATVNGKLICKSESTVSPWAPAPPGYNMGK
jgi:cytoskeletal protein CcmA (bactofilin family)